MVLRVGTPVIQCQTKIGSQQQITIGNRRKSPIPQMPHRLIQKEILSKNDFTDFTFRDNISRRKAGRINSKFVQDESGTFRDGNQPLLSFSGTTCLIEKKRHMNLSRIRQQAMGKQRIIFMPPILIAMITIKDKKCILRLSIFFQDSHYFFQYGVNITVSPAQSIGKRQGIFFKLITILDMRKKILKIENKWLPCRAGTDIFNPFL